jgi:hypothetical protein
MKKSGFFFAGKKSGFFLREKKEWLTALQNMDVL